MFTAIVEKVSKIIRRPPIWWQIYQRIRPRNKQKKGYFAARRKDCELIVGISHFKRTAVNVTAFHKLDRQE